MLYIIQRGNRFLSIPGYVNESGRFDQHDWVLSVKDAIKVNYDLAARIVQVNNFGYGKTEIIEYKA